MKIRAEKKEKKDKRCTNLTKPKVDYLDKIRVEAITWKFQPMLKAPIMGNPN